MEGWTRSHGEDLGEGSYQLSRGLGPRGAGGKQELAELVEPQVLWLEQLSQTELRKVPEKAALGIQMGTAR